MDGSRESSKRYDIVIAEIKTESWDTSIHKDVIYKYRANRKGDPVGTEWRVWWTPSQLPVTANEVNEFLNDLAEGQEYNVDRIIPSNWWASSKTVTASGIVTIPREGIYMGILGLGSIKEGSRSIGRVLHGVKLL